MNSIDQERNKQYESPADFERRHDARGYRKGYLTGNGDWQCVCCQTMNRWSVNNCINCGASYQ